MHGARDWTVPASVSPLSIAASINHPDLNKQLLFFPRRLSAELYWRNAVRRLRPRHARRRHRSRQWSSSLRQRRTSKGSRQTRTSWHLRVLDQNGVSNDSVVIAAIQEAVSLKSKYNVRVINLSLGRPIYESCTRDPLCQAVEAAWKNGIVVVVAAGNLGRNGYSTVLSPGNNPHVITVGA